ncbi:MAG: PIG-L family deacetylase [Acidobacteria bacterium]|jgi:LmbE family N-acetylglucosaminyl deacetylase|nr:PIG-L family deacetylase [Acidobacteriota bacterium]
MDQYQWLPHYRVKDNTIWFLETVDTGLKAAAELSHLLAKNRVISRQQLENSLDKGLMIRLLQEGILVPVKTNAESQGIKTVQEDKRNKVLVIQPHSDDFALSCGAGLAKLSFDQGYHIHCLTLFSQHSVKGFPWRDKVELDDHSYSQLRAREDRLSLEYLSGQVTFLEYKDAFCRGLYLEFLFSREGILKKDRALIPVMSQQIAGIIREYKPAKVFLPAAVGWHYDHRMAYMAAIQALKEVIAGKEQSPEMEIFLYEDYPYCDESRTNYWMRREELSKELNLAPIYMDVTDFIEDKSFLINFYKSQLLDMNLKRIKQKMMQLAEAAVIEARFQQAPIPGSMFLAEGLWRVQDFK